MTPTTPAVTAALVLADKMDGRVRDLVDHTLACKVCGDSDFCPVGMQAIREVVYAAGKYRVERQR